MSRWEPGSEASNRDVARSLRAHVDRVLAASSVPDGQREDVSEELYGHLYERWQEAIATGLLPQAAAASAIEAFGTPGAIGPQLTSAYHSRLYASTIGLLLPTNTSSGGVEGFGRALVLLGLGIVGQLILAVALAILASPLPAIAGIAACLYGALFSVLAIKGLDRGQRWALRFVQAICFIDIVASIDLAFASSQASVLAVGIAVAIDWWIITGVRVPDVSADESVGLRRLATPFAIASLVVAYGVPVGALLAPDPTQAAAYDLSMRVTANCPASGPWSVVADLRWSKTDLFGGRLLPVLNDGIGLSVGRDDDTAPAFPGDAMPAFDEDVTGGDLVDLSTGATIHADLGPADEWTTPTVFNVGNRKFSIDPTVMQAGRTYETTFLLDGASADEGVVWGGRDGRFRVRYEHLGRWGLEVIATCGHTETAWPVPLR